MKKDYLRLLSEFGLNPIDDAPLKIITDEREITKYEKEYKKNHKGIKFSWSKIGIVLEDPYIILLRDLVEFPGGRRGGYIRMINRSALSGSQGVAILPIYNGNLVLLNNYRHSTRSWHLEIPRGMGEQNISSKEQVRIEIAEEIGSELKNIIDLGIFYPDTGFEAQYVSLFFGEISTIGKLEIEAGISEVKFFSPSALEKAIYKGEVNDSFTIVSYFRAKLHNLL